MAQSVCREVLQDLGGYARHGQSGFRCALFTTALRKIVEKDRHLTARKRDADLIVSNAPGSGDSSDPMARLIQRRFAHPSAHAVGRETLERIESAMDEMDEGDREIILLSRLAGLTSSEISERMDIKPATVRGRLTRALAHLADAIT